MHFFSFYLLFRKIFVRIKSLWCSNKSRYKGNKKTEYAIILKAGKEETTFMKNTIKRLSLFLLAVAIIATIVVPNGNTTYAANSYVQKKITISRSAKQVVDSFNGVKAYYRRGGNDGSNSFYSCAAFVKRYYKAVYKRDVYNLLCNRTPQTYGDSFVKVSKPNVGDIVAMNTNHGTTHWAIAKCINNDGTVTLIEQNWKWRQGGTTKSVVNRKVKQSKVRFYRLKSQANITNLSLNVGDTIQAEATDIAVYDLSDETEVIIEESEASIIE